MRGQTRVLLSQNGQFSSFPEKQKRHFFTLPKTSIHAKIREIQCAIFEKMHKTFDFGHFDHFGSNFGQTRPKMSYFRVFTKKQKRYFFTLPKTGIHAKNQGNPTCGFRKKCRKPSIFGIFDHFGSNFGQTRLKMSNFRVFLKKQKLHFFTLPMISSHAKNVGNLMWGFRKKFGKPDFLEF